MNPAASARKRKEARPDLYCPRCLWLTGGGACPRHGGPAWTPERQAAAHDLARQPQTVTLVAPIVQQEPTMTAATVSPAPVHEYEATVARADDLAADHGRLQAMLVEVRGSRWQRIDFLGSSRRPTLAEMRAQVEACAAGRCGCPR